MLAKNQDENKKPSKKLNKNPQIKDRLPSHFQSDTQHVVHHQKSTPYNDIDENPEKTRKKVLARAYSFSMEPPLYEHFRTLCIERGVNSSACVRNLIMLQMKSWRLGEHDETLGDED
jgi:predicted peroxiredoxin|tara:strand:+ start:424 stop:774 length:351 start_codon:yes stop_codon:yes gene_type:complete